MFTAAKRVLAVQDGLSLQTGQNVTNQEKARHSSTRETEPTPSAEK
jgi:hypothetical protein